MNYRKTAFAAVTTGVALVANSAMAAGASLLTATMNTSITTGWDNLQATIIDATTSGMPYVLGITGIILAPRIIKGLVKMAAGH